MENIKNIATSYIAMTRKLVENFNQGHWGLAGCAFFLGLTFVLAHGFIGGLFLAVLWAIAVVVFIDKIDGKIDGKLGADD